MPLESVEVFEKGIDAKGGEEKRESQTQRIDHKKQDPHGESFGCARNKEYGSKDGPYARCPTRRKS